MTNLSFFRYSHLKSDLLQAGRFMAVDKFSLFDSAVIRRGRLWRWAISDQSGNLAMVGAERSKTEARYKATRALFQLLLTAPYRSQSDRVNNRSETASGG
jgi:hypothetical protein